jgi:peptidyl-tRNA hydrolase, PTH1 family
LKLPKKALCAIIGDMKLIVGLGNPGEKYENNRHNVGHIVIDVLEKLPNGVTAKKTNVYMNDSGAEVKKLVNFYKVQANDLYIIHDDLDIPLGSFKIQKGKGPKVHNGVNDIEQVLGTPEFWRVRVGVDNRDPENRTKGDQYVLADFNKEEEKVLKDVTQKIVAELIPQL